MVSDLDLLSIIGSPKGFLPGVAARNGFSSALGGWFRAFENLFGLGRVLGRLFSSSAALSKAKSGFERFGGSKFSAFFEASATAEAFSPNQALQRTPARADRPRLGSNPAPLSFVSLAGRFDKPTKEDR